MASAGGDIPPTRQTSIFTSAILARQINAGTHVLVHDVHREIEDVFSDKFLCSENLVEALVFLLLPLDILSNDFPRNLNRVFRPRWRIP